MQNKFIYKILLWATFATVFAIVTIPSATKAQDLYRQFQQGMTNEDASLLVSYSTSPISLQEGSSTTQVSISGPSHLGHTDLRTSHSTTIPDLMPNTTYYYSIYSRDPAGNVSVTSPKTFTTSN